MNKKLICLLAAALMCGCAAQPQQAAQTEKPAETPKKQEQTAAAIEGDEAFEAFTAKYFKEACEKDYSTAHGYFEDPEKAGIDLSKAKVTFGDVTYSQEEIDDLKKLQTALKTVKADTLNEENQVIYKQMTWETDLNLNLANDKYTYIDSIWGISDGVPVVIANTLSEYRLYTEKDIEPMIELIRDIPNFAAKAMDFTAKQAEKKTLMMDYDEISSYCEGILKTRSSSAVTKNLEAEINDLNLEAEKAAEYKKQVQEALDTCFFPTIEAIPQQLAQYKDKTVPMQGMCNFENGKELYAYKLQNYTATDLTPDQLETEIKSRMDTLSAEYAELVKRNPEAVLESDELATSFKSVDDILPFLKSKYTSLFPAVQNLDYELKPLSEEQCRPSVVAYYMIPTIDSTGPGLIRYNGKDFGSDPTSLDFYMTLAHEGIPGHMYERDYMKEHFNQDIQYTLGCLGTQEGYAEYAATTALDWLGLDQDALKAYKLNEEYTNLLVLVMDLEINWKGASLAEFKDKYGEGIDTLYTQLCEMEGQFFAYYYTP
ncbi:MAG: DUF885 family protein, partial [Erysipelotrichaceae bacterium]|nr:DUF885 family protein [Erysipelotrichaceae bacterium]